ncbi:protein TIFY 6a [Ananas comosus]|uniref:Protein TIFY n=1 Tax=Ananas comosus TaxID=4615 RepID=A0A6P5EG17_ANACO|nr:protein TIFY 6a [Ananas comosus]
MERDFLGINGKESAPSVKDDGRVARQDPAVFGGSAIQWPFSSKVSPVPAFMPFRAAQEQQPKKHVFDQFPSSGFQPISTVDAFEAANQKSSPVLVPQKAFGMDRHGMQQYLYAYQHQGSDSLGASAHQMNRAKAFPVVSHHPIPVGSPFFKLQSSTDSPNITVTPLKQQPFGGGTTVNAPVAGSVVGTLAPRNMPKSSLAQLTIFYAGVVNVFDNVPLDKAQELMLFASKASNTTAVSASPKSDPVIPAAVKLVDSEGLNTKQPPTQKRSHVAPLNSSLSSPVSVASQGGSLSKSASSSNDDSIRPKSAGPLPPSKQNETSTTLPPALGATTAATIMTRAVPQARKASLARFLEKRKERMTNAVPYACAKKPSENADGFENSVMPSKSSSTDITLSSNCEESWNLAQAKNSSHSADSPSTRLEI